MVYLVVFSLEDALKYSPGFADAHVNLGDVYLATGDVDRAKSEYALALATNPDLGLAHVNLGDSRLLEGACDEAKRHFEAAIVHFHRTLAAAFEAGAPEAG